MAAIEQVVIDSDSDSDDDVTLLSPSMVARNRKRRSPIVADDDDDDDDDEDDDVEIIQTPAKRHGASQKRARLAVHDSDDEDDGLQDSDAHGQTGNIATPVQPTTANASSSVRRSSRIERKSQEKDSVSARKLEFRTLENCLSHLQRRGGASAEQDDDEGDDDEDSAEASDGVVDDSGQQLDHAISKTDTKRKRAEVFEEREGRYADGGEDLDDFIVDDNEVEYMDEEDSAVLDVPTSEDEQDAEAAQAQAKEQVLMMSRTRDKKEWFELYLGYIEASLLDRDLDSRMHNFSNAPDHFLYQQALHHIERPMCFRRDDVRGSLQWPEELLEHLKNATQFISRSHLPLGDCVACGRRNHPATYTVNLRGIANGATGLYRAGWFTRLEKSMNENRHVSGSFELGSTCHARVLAYWQLLHAKYFWCAIVDAKMREGNGSQQCLSEAARKALCEVEYGRYKRLLNAVDVFTAPDARNRKQAVRMPNVWKRVTAKYVKSGYLRSLSRSPEPRRRGTLDSVVSESESDGSERGSDAEDECKDVSDETIEREDLDLTKEEEGHDGDSIKQETMVAECKPQNLVEPDDLRCLICEKEPRSAVLHGRYLHVYCCYACAKKQKSSQQGCLICSRPIDNVLRILPFTPEARQAIQTARKKEKGAADASTKSNSTSH